MAKTTNVPLKIVILVFFAALVVGAVALFIPTLLSAPPAVDNSRNCFAEDARDAKNRIVDSLSLEESYQTTLDRLKLFEGEEAISEADYDDALLSYFRAYNGRFRKECDRAFADTVWDEPTLEILRRRVNDILGMQAKSRQGDLVETGDPLRDSLIYVDHTVTTYFEAKRFYLKNKGNWKQASDVIRKAGDYAAVVPVNNCLLLRRRLLGIRTDLMMAHKRYLKAKIWEMRYFKFESYADLGKYSQLQTKTRLEIDDYRDKYRVNIYRDRQQFVYDKDYNDAKNEAKKNAKEMILKAARRAYSLSDSNHRYQALQDAKNTYQNVFKPTFGSDRELDNI